VRKSHDTFPLSDPCQRHDIPHFYLRCVDNDPIHQQFHDGTAPCKAGLCQAMDDLCADLFQVHGNLLEPRVAQHLTQGGRFT